MKYDLKNMSFEELGNLVRDLGMREYRARQIFQWIFQKNVHSISDMTSLSLQDRQRLEAAATVSSLEQSEIQVSGDGSRKYLFLTSDGYGIESVLIPERSHRTLCISTQIGCPLRCRFCYTGRNGLQRDLTTAEIVNQVCAVLELESVSFSRKLPNIVFMGMGEPLANFAATVKSIRILLHQDGLNFSQRKVTVSTAGIVPQMQQLGEMLPVNLAVSLNASNDRIRNYLMPVNKAYALKDVIHAARQFPLPPRKRITFEYILIRGVNDSTECARELAGLLREIPCKINLIPFNPHPAVSFSPPDERTIVAFRNILLHNNFTAPIRRSKGSDIAAACGQLGANHGG